MSTTAIVVHASVPAKNLQEFIAYAKANSGKLSYGSAGTGTMSNLAGELFKQITGLKDLVHIPYKGAGPGITDLVSGHIPAMSPNITGQLLELHRAGKIRILAVNSAERLKAAPDIPTAIEQGVPGMIGLLAIGLFAPAATPKAIVDQIGDANRRAMADPAVPGGLRQGRPRIRDRFQHREDPPLSRGGGDALGAGGEVAEFEDVVRPKTRIHGAPSLSTSWPGSSRP